MECRKKMIRYTLKALLLLCLTSASQAEHEGIFFDNQIIPVVLSATKLPQQQREAPASITVIDRALIEASGATDVADIFRLVPGMQIGNSRGNFPIVAYQGLSSEFPQGVQVIIDGSSVYSPIFGGVIWSLLPVLLEDIERVEVVRGPNNTSFGANSFQGVINITTAHASQVPELSSSFKLNNNQAERAFLRFSNSQVNDRLNYRISVASEKSEGYKKLADDFSKQQLSSRIDFRLNTHNTLQFNFSALDSIRQTRNPIAIAVPIDPKRDRNESSQFAQLIWEHQKPNAEQFNAHLSFHHFDGKDKYNVASNTLDLTTESTTWNIDIEHIQALSDSQRLVWGLGALHESVYAPFRTNSKSNHTNTRLRLFGNLESYLTNKLILNIGGLVEHDKLSGVNTSPRITFSYLASAKGAYRLTATQAYRTPVITEEKREILLPVVGIIQSSTGHLDPETVRSVEAGYHGIFLQNKLNTDLKFFQNHYERLINNNLSIAPKVLDNQHHARTYGTELEVNFRPNRKNIIHMGYAYTRVNHASDERLETSVPKHNFNLLFSRQYTNGWHSGLEYYYMSKMQYLGGQNDPQSPYQRLDLSVGKIFKLANNQTIDITLDAQLALNKNIDLHQQATADNLIYLGVQYHVE
jgi:iron complex outermembrane receptor protein